MKGKIIISETGAVVISAPVMMRDFEIAELFGVIIPMVRSNIRAILRSGVVVADAQHGGTILGNAFYPDYYGLDMIMALVFRIQSPQAEIFRKWILSRAMENRKSISPQIFLSVNNRRNKGSVCLLLIVEKTFVSVFSFFD